jgi:hypothetical protein
LATASRTVLTRHFCAAFEEYISKSAGFEVGLTGARSPPGSRRATTASLLQLRSGKWLVKPVDEWDRNEICLLLDTFVDPEIDRIIFRQLRRGTGYDAFRGVGRLEEVRQEDRGAAQGAAPTEEL